MEARQGAVISRGAYSSQQFFCLLHSQCRASHCWNSSAADAANERGPQFQTKILHMPLIFAPTKSGRGAYRDGGWPQTKLLSTPLSVFCVQGRAYSNVMRGRCVVVLCTVTHVAIAMCSSLDRVVYVFALPLSLNTLQPLMMWASRRPVSEFYVLGCSLFSAGQSVVFVPAV